MPLVECVWSFFHWHNFKYTSTKLETIPKYDDDRVGEERKKNALSAPNISTPPIKRNVNKKKKQQHETSS